MRPYLDALFLVSSTLIPARSRELGDWVAFLVAGAETTGLTLSQLQSFVHHATDDARREFGSALPRHLEHLEPAARERLWRSTLLPYWRDRRTNVPLALAADEVREMIAWIPALPEVAGEALAELQASPGEQLERADHVMWKWKEDNTWVRAHAGEAVGIVAFLAKGRSISPWLFDDAVTVLGVALDAGAAHESVIAAAEHLVARGSQAAAALIERARTAQE